MSIKTTIVGPGTSRIEMTTTLQELYDKTADVRIAVDALAAVDGPHLAAMALSYTLGCYLANIHAAIDVKAALETAIPPLSDAYLGTLRVMLENEPKQ